MSRQSKEGRRARKLARKAAEGGQGAEDRDPHKLMGDAGHSRADAQMVQQAIRHKWKIPESTFDKLPQEILGIFHKKKEGTRERLRAAELILKMHGQNEGQKTEINVNQQVAMVNQRTPAEEAAAMDASVAPPSMTLFGQTIKLSENGNGSEEHDADK